MNRRRLRLWTRNAHLASGLVLASTLLAYALTGFAIVHGGWLPDKTERSTESVAFAYDASRLPDSTTWEATAERAASELELRGRIKLDSELQPDGSLNISFKRLHHATTLRLGPGAGSAILEREELGARKTLGNLHKLHGSRGGAGYRVAAFWLDVTSVAMILFSISGVALWAWLKADRLGAAILAISTLSTVAAIATLTFSA